MSQVIVNNSFGDFTDVVVLDYLDLIDIGTGGTLILAYIPPHGSCSLVQVANITAAAGSSSVQFDVGTTIADPKEFIEALDADGMTAPVANTGTSFVQNAGNTTIEAGTRPAAATVAKDEVYLKLTCADVTSLTAGKWVIGMKFEGLGRYAS